MEREGAKLLEGRVAQFILLVVVSMCDVFCVLCCLQNNPVFSSVTISHILKNENYELCFWRVPSSIKLRPENKVQSSGRLCFSAGSFIDQISTGKHYDQKKGTVVWPTVEINLR